MNNYLISSRRKKTIIGFLICLIIGSFILNIMIGSSGMSFMEVIETILMKRVGTMNHTIVWNIRLPIGLMAIVVGSSLAIGGLQMQTVLRNSMASPYTLGISSAASFGAGLGIILGVKIFPGFDNLIVPINAFIATMIAAFILYGVSNKEGISRNTIVLFGMALSFMFSALTASLQYIASEQALKSFMFWSFGDLSKTNWNKLGISALVFLVVYILFLKDAWKLTALSLGDTKARALGVEVSKIRRKTIVLVAFLAATCISFVGTIGFIGLVAPHIARLLVGEDQRFLLPISALIGGFILSLASIVSKVIIPGVLLPIGIVTSLIGIPFFIALIFRKGDRI